MYMYLKQTLTGLDTSQTYTLSVDYKAIATATVAAQYDVCHLGWMENDWSGFLDRIAVSPAAVGMDPGWSVYTVSYQPTASTQALLFVWSCMQPTFTLDFDNFQLPLSTQVCITSTLSSTPPASSSALLSVAVPPSSTPSSSLPGVRSSAVVASSAALSSSSPAAFASSIKAVVSSSTVVSSAVPVRTPSSLPVSLASSRVPASRTVIASSIPFSSSAGVKSRSAALYPSNGIPLGSSVSRCQIPTSVSSSEAPASSSLGMPGAPSSSIPGASSGSIPSPTAPQSTASTILTTRTTTATSCPSTVTDCPARQHTTYLTTETVVIPTSMRTFTEGSHPTHFLPAVSQPGNDSENGSSDRSTTSTIFITRTSTVTVCSSSANNCHASEHTTYVTTETLVDYTTICPVAATQTGVSTILDATLTGTTLGAVETESGSSGPFSGTYAKGSTAGFFTTSTSSSATHRTSGADAHSGSSSLSSTSTNNSLLTSAASSILISAAIVYTMAALMLSLVI